MGEQRERMQDRGYQRPEAIGDHRENECRYRPEKVERQIPDVQRLVDNRPEGNE